MAKLNFYIFLWLECLFRHFGCQFSDQFNIILPSGFTFRAYAIQAGQSVAIQCICGGFCSIFFHFTLGSRSWLKLHFSTFLYFNMGNIKMVLNGRLYGLKWATLKTLMATKQQFMFKKPRWIAVLFRFSPLIYKGKSVFFCTQLTFIRFLEAKFILGIKISLCYLPFTCDLHKKNFVRWLQIKN